MKKLIYALGSSFCTLFFLLTITLPGNAQVDYTLKAISSQTPSVCTSGANTGLTIVAEIKDSGANGMATDYVWDIPPELNLISGSQSGSVPNNSTGYSIITIGTTSSAILGVTYTVTLTATYNGGMGPVPLDFKVTVNAPITNVSISSENGGVICDNNVIRLDAVNVQPSAAIPAYEWDDNPAEANSYLYTSVAGSHKVRAYNLCNNTETPPEQGNGISAFTTTTAEVTPNLTINQCTNANDQLTFAVTATDNDNAGITVTFHEGDPANPSITTGGDYSITQSNNQYTLVVNNVNPNHNNTNFYAKAVNSCGTTISLACLAQPIELEYFSGRYTEEGVLLDWATATETNNDFFTIERSADGLNFKAIAEIDGAGTSFFTQTYDYLDREAVLLKEAGTLYYRLKQTDFDGATSYSDLITVQVEGFAEFEIPAVSLREGGTHLQFQLQNSQNGQALLSIYRLDGQQVFHTTLATSKGLQTYQVDLPEALSSGMYLLRLESGKQAAVKKFISLR